MSVFGGDSWAREAQHRKRRVEDLLVSDASSSSYKKLTNGKYACLVCPNNPIVDSPLMISMHSKGSRHLTAEARLKQRELSRQDELNKRIALSSVCDGISSPGASIQQPKHLEVHKKPLIEKTRKIILETQSHKPDNLNSNPSAASNHRLELSQNMRHNESSNSSTGKVLANWHAELRKRQEEELKFTEAGWKRDGHGKWFRDENVEFDSDEEDPNDSLK